METSYSEIIDEYPFGLIVFELVDPQNTTSITFRYLNNSAENFRFSSDSFNIFTYSTTCSQLAVVRRKMWLVKS